MKKRWYTFVGYYGDNSQPIVLHGKGSSPLQATRSAINRMEKAGNDSSAINFVEGFEGRYRGLLGYDTVEGCARILQDADIEEEHNEIKKASLTKLLLMVGQIKFKENHQLFEARLKGFDNE